MTGAGNVAITGTLGVSGVTTTDGIVSTATGTNAQAFQLNNSPGSGYLLGLGGSLAAAGFTPITQAGDAGLIYYSGNGMVIAAGGTSGGLRMDSSGNMVETGNLTVSGTLGVGSLVTVNAGLTVQAGSLTAKAGLLSNQTATNGVALQLTSSGSTALNAFGGTLGAGGFNAASQAGDCGLIYTNSSGFVLAPNPGTVGCGCIVTET